MIQVDLFKTAIDNIKKVQIVTSALHLPLSKYYVLPIHFFMKDKSGNGAVIEFIDGKTQITKSMDGKAQIDVLTNSPRYSWQIENYEQEEKKFQNRNTDFQVGIEGNKVFANGSGYRGLPGDYMPQSRFVRAKTLLKALPQAFNTRDAGYGLNMVLNSIVVPVGMNPAATAWYSKFNLATGGYYITNLMWLVIDKHFFVHSK